MPNFNLVKAAIVPMALLANLATAAAQIEPSSSDCLNISVDTGDLPQLDAAINICTHVLSRNDLTTTTRAELLAHRGVAYRNIGHLNDSQNDLVSAQSLAPGDASVSRMLAWTYREMGNLAQAEEEYGRALKLEPHSQAFLSRCFVRHDMKKFEDALADCEAAHSSSPSEDSTYMTALLYAKVGRSSSALPLLEGAIGTPIESGRLYGLLADIYDSKGQPNEAARIRQQGHRKFPKDNGLMLPPGR
jgi:tetratricopeptide (TPR) repeat protein